MAEVAACRDEMNAFFAASVAKMKPEGDDRVDPNTERLVPPTVGTVTVAKMKKDKAAG